MERRDWRLPSRARGLDARLQAPRYLAFRDERQSAGDSPRGIVQAAAGQIDPGQRQVHFVERGIPADGIEKRGFGQVRPALLQVFAALRLTEAGAARIDCLHPCVRPLREPQVGLAETVRVLRIAWSQIHQRAVLVGQADDVVDALARIGELQVNGRLPRHQLGRATQHAARPLAGRAPAGWRPRAGGRPEGWIEPGRCPELDERVRVPSAPLQNDPEIVVNEGAVAARRITARNAASAASRRPAARSATPSENRAASAGDKSCGAAQAGAGTSRASASASRNRAPRPRTRIARRAASCEAR